MTSDDMDEETSTVDSRLLVVGAGTMGTQIALQAGIHGVDVNLFDVDEKALKRAESEVGRLIQQKLGRNTIDTEAAAGVFHHLLFHGDLREAASDADWAIEAVVEQFDIKLRLFADLDAVLPVHAGIATNSSSILASRLAQATSRPERCLNMHFFHPVLAMDLCEIVAAPQVSPDIVEQAVGWAQRLRRRPVVLWKEVDGFIVNRILSAASCEAFSLVADSVAAPADVDVAVRQGLRWPLGPFELADLSGLDVVLDVRRSRQQLDPDPANLPSIALLEALVRQGRLGRKNKIGFYDYSTDPPTPLSVNL
jgi:3-hydroxybutyryl-CoA dehydrogenase